MLSNRRRTFKINHRAPTSECTAAEESLLGALGIPEWNRLIDDEFSK